MTQREFCHVFRSLPSWLTQQFIVYTSWQKKKYLFATIIKKNQSHARQKKGKPQQTNKENKKTDGKQNKNALKCLHVEVMKRSNEWYIMVNSKFIKEVSRTNVIDVLSLKVTFYLFMYAYFRNFLLSSYFCLSAESADREETSQMIASIVNIVVLAKTFLNIWTASVLVQFYCNAMIFAQ